MGEPGADDRNLDEQFCWKDFFFAYFFRIVAQPTRVLHAGPPPVPGRPDHEARSFGAFVAQPSEMSFACTHLGAKR